MSRPAQLARALAPALALAVVWLVSTNHGPFSSIKVNDLYVYGVYAHNLGDGLIPYRDFDFEYPPVALIPIGLLGDHEVAFSLSMLACALVCQDCVRRISGAKGAWAMVALPLLAGAQVRTHFDLFVTALVMLALVNRRNAGLLLGAATAAKLWPALVALATLRDRRNWREFAIVTIPLALLALVLGGWVMVRFHIERPIQIESTQSTVLSLLPVDVSTTGYPISPDRFKSNGTDAGIAGLVGVVFTAIELGAIAWFVWKADRDPILAALGVTLAFVAFGKVLSPQFMLWLFPLAVAAWGWQTLFVAAATALTQVEFPLRYFDLVNRDQTMLGVIAARNALLVIALAATARALARSNQRGPAVSTGSALR